ncbi:MAG: transketolase [Candidatus Altiarchaeales archaeon]|nr:transketolase [Candidatus Altiarchaeales archaeon]MBD3415647.1 transketolase [Candidatus Altiarchaeales archaeon]
MNGSPSKSDLEGIAAKSREIRRHVLRMVHCSGSSHVGSALSVADILSALYFRKMKFDPDDDSKPSRDRFIMSKGHAASALYATLSLAGFFPEKELDSYCQNGSMLEGHVNRKVPGVEVSTGSLGHGLSIGSGMAYAARKDGEELQVYVLLGDGECNEGSVWEAAMLSSRLGLDNLVAIVDSNKLQAYESSETVFPQKRLVEMWRSAGWSAREVNGHDIGELCEAFDSLPFEKGKPSLVFANTEKGSGISYMEGQLCWHYRCPDKQELKKALEELG